MCSEAGGPEGVLQEGQTCATWLIRVLSYVRAAAKNTAVLSAVYRPTVLANRTSLGASEGP